MQGIADEKPTALEFEPPNVFAVRSVQKWGERQRSTSVCAQGGRRTDAGSDTGTGRNTVAPAGRGTRTHARGSCDGAQLTKPDRTLGRSSEASNIATHRSGLFSPSFSEGRPSSITICARTILYAAVRGICDTGPARSLGGERHEHSVRDPPTGLGVPKIARGVCAKLVRAHARHCCISCQLRMGGQHSVRRLNSLCTAAPPRSSNSGHAMMHATLRRAKQRRQDVKRTLYVAAE